MISQFGSGLNEESRNECRDVILTRQFTPRNQKYQIPAPHAIALSRRRHYALSKISSTSPKTPCAHLALKFKPVRQEAQFPGPGDGVERHRDAGMVFGNTTVDHKRLALCHGVVSSVNVRLSVCHLSGSVGHALMGITHTSSRCQLPLKSKLVRKSFCAHLLHIYCPSIASMTHLSKIFFISISNGPKLRIFRATFRKSVFRRARVRRCCSCA